ncbi:MAG TPA: glycosyltransferase family 4 protein [Rhizomicrobium sp.]|nr:glycosyltransferase family 4 protein [Rhizomicrobium sp.]
MRVLVIHDGEGPLRGADKVAFDLMTGLRPQGVVWQVATNQAEFKAAAEQAGFPSAWMPFRRLFIGGTKWRDLADAVRAFKALRLLVHDFKPDLIHLNNGGACQWAVPAAWLAGVPALVHIHARWSRKMRLLLGLHLPDRIIAVSHASAERFLGDPVAARKVRVIHNAAAVVAAATPEERAAERAKMDIAPDVFVVAYVGVLIAGKRPQDAIEAVALLPQAVKQKLVLLFVGDGEVRPELERAAVGLPVRFLGYRPDVDRITRLVCDATILPSPIEAFPLVLLEAAACGLPRIAAAAAGNLESVTDGRDGLLCKPGDIKAYAEAIAKLAADRSYCLALGEEARNRVARDFSPANFLAHFLQTYQEMRAAPRRSGWAKAADAIRSLLNVGGKFRFGGRAKTPAKMEM